MKKNVCITIKSTQTVDQDKDSTELFTFGAMESTENGFRLYYDESEATGFAGSSVTLEVTDEMVEKSSKTLSTMLVDECDKQYGHHPGDDATACVVRIRRREPMNLLFGPPRNRDDCDRMMSLFFSKEGKHIVCGGTTSSIAARYLGKPLRASLNFERSDVPPIAEIEGVDLVTEGVITINKVLTYAKDYLDQNDLYEQWSIKRDGASMICRLLFEEATDINFFVGRAVNPAHQNPNLPIGFSIKMRLVDELSEALKKMGKRIKVSYF